MSRLWLLLPLWLVLSGQAPNSQRVAQPGPSVKGEAAQRAHSQISPITNATEPVPVRVVEDTAETFHAQDRETKSDTHDAEDLNAQNRAASAAEAQWWPSWANAALTFGGTLLILWTLYLTRQTNALARAAYEADNRAWVKVEMETPQFIQRAGETLSATALARATNTGKGIATNVRVHAQLAVWDDATKRLTGGAWGETWEYNHASYLFPGDTQCFSTNGHLFGLRTMVAATHGGNDAPTETQLFLIIQAQYHLVTDPAGTKPRVTDAIYAVVIAHTANDGRYDLAQEGAVTYDTAHTLVGDPKIT